MSNDTLTITANGRIYAGWKSVRVTASLEAAARSFVVEVTDRWPADDTEKQKTIEQGARIVPGDQVEVRIGADLVCTGHVDATPREYDAHGYMFAVQGRSLTADLVDSSADNPEGQWRGAKPEKIARDVAGRYGVTVKTEAATGAALADHQIQPGETAFESLDRVARARQFLLTDDEHGALVLAKPGSGGHAISALELGVNILSGSAGLDYSDAFAEYVVRGQKTGTDDSFGPDATQVEAKAADNTIRRRRLLIIRQSGQADAGTCRNRADYEARYRNAKALATRYFVQGWRQADGSLWKVNTLVHVRDAFIGHDRDLLISEINYLLDREGTRAEIYVVPPDAFLTEPEIEAAKKVKGDDKKKKATHAKDPSTGMPKDVTWVEFPE